MDLSKRLGEKLSILIRSSGRTQTQVADNLGMPLSHLNRFLNGRSELNSDNLISVLKEFDIDLETIISNKIKKQSTVDENEIESVNDCLKFLYWKLDILGRQTFLNSLASASKNASRKKVPEQVERILAKELNLI